MVQFMIMMTTNQDLDQQTYDVEDVIELLNTNLKEAQKKALDYESTEDIIENLRVRCVSKNQKSYISLLTLCFCFIFKTLINIECIRHG